MSTKYQIKLETGRTLIFEIHDRRSADLIKMSSELDIPLWARLEHHQCPICPFKTNETKFCPAAFELQDVIAQCSDQISHERVEFSRISDKGAILTHTDMQTALFTVIGGKAISSACTVLNTRYWTLDYYSSMLITPENMFYRSLSSYLVRQFLLGNAGKKADFELENLSVYIDEVVTVFGSLLERLRQVSCEDASNNAIVKLVMIGQLLKSTRDKWIDELKVEAGV